MLTQLVRQQIAALRSGSPDLRFNAYRRVMGDPLAHLQRLLGHARASTTYVYLDESSGIASGGRETAGHLVAVVPE